MLFLILFFFKAIAFFRTDFASRRVVGASSSADAGITSNEFDVLKESDEANRNDICVFVFAIFVKILRKTQIEWTKPEISLYICGGEKSANQKQTIIW